MLNSSQLPWQPDSNLTVSSEPRAVHCDLAVAVAAVLMRHLDDVGREPLFVVLAPRHPALGRAVLAERCTSAALRDTHRVHDVLNTGAPARRAQ